MKILVACEFSGIVRDAFIERGHDAISCDLLPSESDHGPHIQGDVTPLLREPWDMVIAHPPCTYLSVARGAFPNHLQPAQDEAVAFFQACQNANAPLVAVENPVTYLAVRERIGQHDQIIHPWQFGDMYHKRTCLWLKGLPPLLPLVAGSEVELPLLVQASGKTYAAGRRANKSGHRSPKLRSQFHPGMAAAMADQWT